MGSMTFSAISCSPHEACRMCVLILCLRRSFLNCSRFFSSWFFSCFWRRFPAPDTRNRSDPGPAVNSSVVTGWVVRIWCGWTMVLRLAASVFVAVIFERSCGVVLNLLWFALYFSLIAFFFSTSLLIIMECWLHSYSYLKRSSKKYISVAPINHKHVGCIPT